MEERLIELETKVAFQEDTIQTLNDIIARQQQEIDYLRQAVDAVREQVISLTPTQQGPGAEPPPPHY